MGELENILTTERPISRGVKPSELALYAAIVEQSDDAIICKTLDGTVLTWNSGAERMFGYFAAEMIRCPILRLFPADRLHEEASLIAQLQAGKKISHFETRRVRKDGVAIDVSVTLSPVRDANGTIVAISKIARDISERRQTLELREMNQELERSNRDLEDFAYIASHDLRTPLSGIRSAALWLQEDLQACLSDESQELLTLMQSRITRMEKMLDDLLAFARIGRTELSVSEAKFANVVTNILGILNPPAHMRVSVDGEVTAILTAGPQLEQVLRNLIDNAIKHHDKALGEIVVSAKRRGEFLEFAVRDDGPGILPRFHDKIFELFQTLRRRDDVEGSGMGLAIVKRLVERQRCQIAVHSQGDGTGSEFRFLWPALPAAPAFPGTVDQEDTLDV